MKNVLLELMLVFMKIGFFTFGGGYAMIPAIEDICVNRKKWIDHNEMSDMVALAESTPGPIAINCSTFVGFKQGGFLGAVAATFGVVAPSFLVIFIVSVFLDGFLEYTVIANAFRGIKVGVGILIASVGLNMLNKFKSKPVGIIVALVSFLVTISVNIFAINFSSVFIILVAAFLGLIFFIAGKGAKRK